MRRADVVAAGGRAVTRRTEQDAHADLLRSAEWQRMRAGVAVQGPYRRQRRVGRWLLASVIAVALVAAALS